MNIFQIFYGTIKKSGLIELKNQQTKKAMIISCSFLFLYFLFFIIITVLYYFQVYNTVLQQYYEMLTPSSTPTICQQRKMLQNHWLYSAC